MWPTGADARFAGSRLWRKKNETNKRTAPTGVGPQMGLEVRRFGVGLAAALVGTGVRREPFSAPGASPAAALGRGRRRRGRRHRRRRRLAVGHRRRFLR